MGSKDASIVDRKTVNCRSVSSPAKLLLACLTAGLAGIALTACESLEGNIAVGTVGATLFGARTPAHELEQVYYLGSFDPQGQLPPTIYRFRVRGQASIMSGTRFASGWVPAPVVDSLTTHFGFPTDRKKLGAVIDKGEEELVNLTTGRRLMQFGPEGFREAPANHRLVIVMGTSPEAFFQGVTKFLGNVSTIRQEQATAKVDKQILADILKLQSLQQRLGDLKDGVNTTVRVAEASE